MADYTIANNGLFLCPFPDSGSTALLRLLHQCSRKIFLREYG